MITEQDIVEYAQWICHKARVREDEYLGLVTIVIMEELAKLKAKNKTPKNFYRHTGDWICSAAMRKIFRGIKRDNQYKTMNKYDDEMILEIPTEIDTEKLIADQENNQWFFRLFFGLVEISDRDKKILSLLLAGKERAEIAKTLGISTHFLHQRMFEIHTKAKRFLKILKEKEGMKDVFSEYI